MGKGKGSFDHWATRVAVNQIVFELRGVLHEQVIRDAFRLAGNKLPGKSPAISAFIHILMITKVSTKS
jgi:ribosomal protein L16/L10AE